MRDPHLTSDRSVEGPLRLVLGAIGLLAGFDLLQDLGGGSTVAHVAAELTVSALALLSLLALLCRARAQAHRLAAALATSRADTEHWRREAHDALRGLGALIDAQFGRWGLSPAEKDTALLLLKGLSHREIASLRSVSEATARQQASAVYRKAQVEGRSALAAFFLEDLALPTSPPPAGVPTPDLSAGPPR